MADKEKTEAKTEDPPAAGWVATPTEEIVAPDGHVTWSKEDIKNARDK